MTVLNGKNILLGVTGSIAAYKAADLASKLAQAGAQMDVILTASAEKFVTSLTFQSVTSRRAYIDTDLWGNEAHILHVSLGKTSDIFVIAPCTANTIAKLAHGEADNLLTVVALAARCPLLIAPAMDGGMYDHTATQENLKTLKGRGVTIVGPSEGHLASGLSGKGRMTEPTELLGHIRFLLGRRGLLSDKKVVVTAGGTQEPLDPVRVLTNRSSGRQGYALAQAAVDEGAEVTLISTPTSFIPPIGARVVSVETTNQMLDAVMKESVNTDVLIMAAAVADFRPKKAAATKMKKRDGIPQMELEETEDILKTVAGLGPGKKRPRIIVGFAAESSNLLENASEKLKAKKIDMIVANDISSRDAGFGVETNRVTLLFADGKQEALPLMSKGEVAEILMQHIATLLE